ncbi:hypothetical protein [Sessilibacter sp. MAH2]
MEIRRQAPSVREIIRIDETGKIRPVDTKSSELISVHLSEERVRLERRSGRDRRKDQGDSVFCTRSGSDRRRSGRVQISV